MTQDEIIEMARQAGCPMADMMPMYFTDKQLLSMLEAFAKLVAAKAIAELESQELKQITVKDFVHMVEGREDLIGRPVCFAQWPNGNTHPPQRTEQAPVKYEHKAYTMPPQPEQKTSADDFFKTIADRNPKPFPPSQREWVGLTFREQQEAILNTHSIHEALIKAEAKLKEKNT
jgi:hypothetical protein